MVNPLENTNISISARAPLHEDSKTEERRRMRVGRQGQDE